jgi:hypothetical protein
MVLNRLRMTAWLGQRCADSHGWQSDVWHTPDHYGSDLFYAIHGMPS